jgi:hypothetical protein
MISRLHYYFGIAGILSILGWAVALALLAGWARSARRTLVYATAFGVAVVALALANLNSHFIGLIRVDRSEELAEGIQRQKEAARQLRDRAAGIRFAEDSPTDPLDLAGVKADEKKNIHEMAAMPDEDPDRYAYRQHGRQQRVITEAGTNLVVSAGDAPLEIVEARLMTEPDWINANRLDRLNLFFARFAFWLALGLVVVDYLSRFNRTADHLWPLPLSNRLLDSVWPKKHAVLVAKSGPRPVRDLLANMVRKGETFIYFGPSDPLQSPTAPRLRFHKWSAWPLRNILCGPGPNAHDDEFILESAWFHRYCFTVIGRDRARAMLPQLLDFLRMRHLTRAVSRRTVNLVWDFDEPLPEDFVHTLAALCRETNYKLIVVVSGQPTGEFARRFEEVVA